MHCPSDFVVSVASHVALQCVRVFFCYVGAFAGQFGQEGMDMAFQSCFAFYRKIAGADVAMVCRSGIQVNFVLPFPVLGDEDGRFIVVPRGFDDVVVVCVVYAEAAEWRFLNDGSGRSLLFDDDRDIRIEVFAEDGIRQVDAQFSAA